MFLGDLLGAFLACAWDRHYQLHCIAWHGLLLQPPQPALANVRLRPLPARLGALGHDAVARGAVLQPRSLRHGLPRGLPMLALLDPCLTKN